MLTCVPIEQHPLVLHSKWFFAAFVTGCSLYAYVLIELVNDLPNGWFEFGVYSLFGVGLVYTTLASAAIVELSQDELKVRSLLGIRSPIRFKLKDARRILMRPNNFNQVTRVVIEFADGRKVQLHQYQKNFETARVFLMEHLSGVPCEMQSKWAL